MNDYEKQLMLEAASDLRKALNIIKGIDHNLSFVDTIHYSVISNCSTILETVAEDLFQKSKIEVVE